MSSIEEAKEISHLNLGSVLSSKAGENLDGVFDLEKGENCSSVATKQNVFGAETVVDSTFDINSGLVDVEVENGDLIRALESDGGKSHPVDMNDVFGDDEHVGKCGEDGAKSFLVDMNGALSNQKTGEVACIETGEKCSGKQEINSEKTKELNDGIVLPDVDIRHLSIPECCPDELLKILASYAKEVSFKCLLELSVVKSWLSAFYRGDRGLPAYCEPVYIEGLEDKNKTVLSGTGDFNVPVEVPVMGPCEDDLVVSSAGGVKSQASLDDKRYQRKQKSVAELMAEGNSLVKPKSRNRAKEVKEEKRTGKSVSLGKRRNGDDDGEKVVKSSKGKTGRKRMEIKVDVAEDSSDEAKEELCIISSPRERKKSKYLSPPYTNPGWSVRNLGSGKSFAKIESSTSPSVISESTDDIELREESETSGQTSANDKRLTFSVSDVDVQVVDWLLDVQFAAVDPFYLSKKGCLDAVWTFASALRSYTYSNGTEYRKLNPSGKKRKSLRNQESDVFSQEKVKSGDDAKAPKSVKKKAGEGKKSNAKKSKKKKGNVSTCLILTFTPGFPLPSKEEIVGLFGKFGSLDENETNVVAESCSVRIVYTKESDAEVAFRSSIAESPFDVENVSYWLQHLSGYSEASGALEKDLEPSEERDEFMSDVGVIRKKLEMMTSILGNCHSEFSAEEKSSFKDEMKNLMEDVDTMSEKVRVMAEKSSS